MKKYTKYDLVILKYFEVFNNFISTYQVSDYGGWFEKFGNKKYTEEELNEIKEKLLVYFKTGNIRYGLNNDLFVLPPEDEIESEQMLNELEKNFEKTQEEAE